MRQPLPLTVNRAAVIIATSENSIIKQTQCWVSTVIVECNFCPFAKRELERGSIRYSVVQDTALDICLHAVIDESIFLDSNDTTETTLLIFPNTFSEFADYLQFVEMAETLIMQHGYEGVYQLASFHPDYVFADAESNDAANYTNRSPFPMLHLIREASVEKALANYPEPELIPERNVKYARAEGKDAMKARLEACCSMGKTKDSL
jgi:hypothetical protein